MIPPSIKSRFQQGKIALTPPLPTIKNAERDKISQVFPLNAPVNHGVFTYNGSAAIYQAARILGLGRTSNVLLPAYCCGSEQEPLNYLGCSVYYYGLTDNLQLNLDEIQAFLDTHSIQLVYATHFFGFPQVQIETLCELCNDRGIPVIEDCALSLYSVFKQKPLGSFADFAVFSERKSLPLTEGGYLVRNGIPLPENVRTLKPPPVLPYLDRLLNLNIKSGNETSSANDHISANRLKLYLLLPASLIIKVCRVIGQKYKPTWQSPETEGRKAAPMYEFGMSQFSRKQFCNTDPDQVVQKRRELYTFWLEHLDRIPGCTPLFSELPDGCSPLYMPVMCSQQEQALDYFQSRDIEVSRWWFDERTDIDWQKNANLLPIKRNLLVLPVHHEIDLMELRARILS